MGFKYKLIQRKDLSPDAAPDDKLFYAQAVNNGTVSTEELSKDIAEETALTDVEILGVFNRLVRHLVKNLQNGRTVVIDNFGTFHMTVGSTGAARAEDFDAATMMKTPRIIFTPHKALKKANRDVTFERINVKDEEEEKTETDSQG